MLTDSFSVQCVLYLYNTYYKYSTHYFSNLVRTSFIWKNFRNIWPYRRRPGACRIDVPKDVGMLYSKKTGISPVLILANSRENDAFRNDFDHFSLVSPLSI